MLILSVLMRLGRGGCEACECFKRDCSLLNQYDPLCKDQFQNSCHSRERIVPTKKCDLVCDCCIKNKCLTTADFNCFVYNTFEIQMIAKLCIFFINFILILIVYRRYFVFNSVQDEKTKIKGLDYSF